MKLHLSASQWLSGLWTGHVHRWWRSSPSWEPLRKRGLGHRRQTPAGRARCPACRHLLTRLPGRDGSGAQRTQFSIKDAALHASCRRLASIVVRQNPRPLSTPSRASRRVHTVHGCSPPLPPAPPPPLHVAHQARRLRRRCSGSGGTRVGHGHRGGYGGSKWLGLRHRPGHVPRGLSVGGHLHAPASRSDCRTAPPPAGLGVQPHPRATGGIRLSRRRLHVADAVGAQTAALCDGGRSR